VLATSSDNSPVERTERVPVSTAVGRTLAEPVIAGRPGPHYDRGATDGVPGRFANQFGDDVTRAVGQRLTLRV
jgi:molybdopterin biosynthesis enzyme